VVLANTISGILTGVILEASRSAGETAPIMFTGAAFSPRLHGIGGKAERVERCLRRAALWDEIKDRLDQLGSLLSGRQQQQLTIARALSQEPELLLRLDEFSIAVDPVTTMRIEDVLRELKQEMTLVMVTNLVQQARRASESCVFMLLGKLIEHRPTADLFVTPRRQETADYIEGRSGQAAALPAPRPGEPGPAARRTTARSGS
jgi:phosphate transport system ATP-binding protein